MRHLPLTTKQMMDSSFIFKLCFVSAIVLCTATIVLSCVLPYANCGSTQPCPNYYSYYTDDCFRGGDHYCCNYLYSYCGDPSYCITKPNYYKACWGIDLAIDCCGGATFFLAVAVFIMFCNFRRRTREPMYNPVLRQQGNPVNQAVHFSRPVPQVRDAVVMVNEPRGASQQGVQFRRRGEEPSLLTEA